MAITYHPPSQWETTLLATVRASGLVDQLALHRAASQVASQQPTSDEDHDRRLAERLAEQGVLNAWQVGQLRRGRTKFTLGPYRILDSIARGGMGHVFKCRHELLGRVEAIKVLPLTKSTPDSIASFRHEIRAQASLDHPNIVRVHFADRDRETYYLVTEFVPGIDLRRLVRRGGPLSENVAAWVMSQTALALDHAHRHGLVHRDVKPGNILLTPHGTVKVTDLGLAISVAGLVDKATEGSYAQSGGKVAGTSDYVAPEAIREPDRVRPASDLYGLGCTLYYAVTGKVPFPGGSHVDKLRRRLRDEPIDPQALAPKLSPTMAGLIRKLMAKRPDDRPGSAAEVADALLRLTSPNAETALALLVNQALTVRSGLEETTPEWASGATDDLPETVGLPLHDAADLGGETAEPPLSHRSGEAGRRSVPLMIAVVALVAVAAIAALAAWRVAFGG